MRGENFKSATCRVPLFSGIDLWYISTVERWRMGKSGVAKLFRNGRSQAVRLPREFRFEGDAVRVLRVPEGVLLEPMIPDPKEWFAAMDRRHGEKFLKTGGQRPKEQHLHQFDCSRP